MKPFGTEFCDHIAIARYAAGAWSAPSIEPLAPLSLHPAAHVFHYASSCFEGFKAYRWADGKGRIFRLHDHVARMRRSVVLPAPFGPKKPKISPRSIARVSPHTASKPFS